MSVCRVHRSPPSSVVHESIRLREVEEDDDRRIADGGVMAGEGQAARLAVHAKDREVVGPLIAAVEEPAGGVEVEAAWIVPACPLLADIGQGAGSADGKDRDAVVQTVACIEEPALGRNQDFRGEIAARESRRQGGDGLPCGQPPLLGIVVKQDDVRAFLLKAVEPAAIRMEEEMPRPVSRRQRNRGRIVRSEYALGVIELPDEDSIPGPDRRAERSGPQDRSGSCAHEFGRVR